MIINPIYSLSFIETPRLLIRPVQLGDAASINKSINDSLEALQQWMPWAKDPSIEATRDFEQRGVFSWMSGCARDFPMVIIHKKDNKIIGAGGFNERSNSSQGLYEIGYWCDINYQGQGLITEYVNALCRYAFDALGANKIVISMDTANQKSAAIPIRLNFIYAGVRHQSSLGSVPNPEKESAVYYLTHPNNLPALDYLWSHTEERQLPQKMISWAQKCLSSSELNTIRGKAIVTTPWSLVFECHTNEGLFYLKKTPPLFSLEPEIIRFCKEHLEASVPEIVAENSELSCFMMKNAGKNLRTFLKKDFDESLVLKAISHFTKVQSKSCDYIDALLTLGVPDYRLSNLPRLYHNLIAQISLLESAGLKTSQIQALHDLSAKVSQICDELDSYMIQPAIVQIDFNDNNTLFDDSSAKVVMIDIGEIVISHPFFSLLNFLQQMQRHHGVTPDTAVYQRLKHACFEHYQPYFTEPRDFENAETLADIAFHLLDLVYWDRFISACGKDNLVAHHYWKFPEILRKFMQKIQSHST